VQLSQSKASGPAYAAAINAHVPRMYQLLTDVLAAPVEGDAAAERERDQARSIISSTLKNHAVVLLNSSWYSSSRFAFPSSDSSTEAPAAKPYLHTVPEALIPFAELLIVLGARARFEPADYAFVLKRMAQELATRSQMLSGLATRPLRSR
jgi:hypothetical protein